MERKIGEIFEHEGNWYQCVEPPKNVIGNLCKRCDMRCILIKRYKVPECRADFRSDKKYVIFKKLEPVGDPYPLYGHTVQRYAGVTAPVILPKEPFAYYNTFNGTVDIEVKQQNKDTEDMETTNEKTLTIPEGWEFDRIDGDNIVLKKKELPKTWHGCLRTVNETEYINDCSDIDTQTSIDEMERGGYLFGDCDRNLLPVGLAAPMLALCQLLVCRNAWWKLLGWKPNWEMPYEKHCIVFKCDGVEKQVKTYEGCILAFPKYEVCDQFLETFRDLIEEAKELL